MSGPTVWVVSGEVGEYSDRSWWVVRAFATKADAYAFLAQINALIDGLYEAPGKYGERVAKSFHPYDREPEAVAAFAPIRALDPEFADSYTGPVKYHVNELPMGAPLLASVEVTA